ncbi:MAG: hypothetical protein R3C32_12130 [Chloroflexota bacterium]
MWLATGATAQSPGRPTDLVGSLLTTEDLPPGLVSQGIDEPPRFDIDDASFQALGGLRAVGQVWQRAGGTPLIVFDHRMAFPDADAAAAYLDAAEPILSEAAASGLTPVVSDDPVGEHGRHYAGETVAGDTTVQLHNFLFHVGPVAAKVFVGGVDLPAGLPAEVAAAAASRMETAAGGPSPAAPAPSDAASPAPSEASGPIGDVLAHVPASVRATCDEADRSGSEVAVVACTPPDGPAVLYALYDNGIAVDGDFTSITATLPTPRATTCAEGPFLGTYAVGGEVVGQLACWTADDTSYLVASDKRIPMIVLLLGRDGDTAALEEALTRLAPTP